MSPQLEAVRRAEHDVGERSNFILLPMVNAALDPLLSWGVDRIATTLRAPHMLGLTRKAGVFDDLIAGFREHSVYVGIRGDALRVAPHLRMSDADLDRFRGALRGLA